MITIHQRHRRTDRQTTCDRNTALCTKVHRAVKMTLVFSKRQACIQSEVGLLNAAMCLWERCSSSNGVLGEAPTKIEHLEWSWFNRNLVYNLTTVTQRASINHQYLHEKLVPTRQAHPSSFCGVSSSTILTGSPSAAWCQTRVGWENRPFSSFKRQYLENGRRYVLRYY